MEHAGEVGEASLVASAGDVSVVISESEQFARRLAVEVPGLRDTAGRGFVQLLRRHRGGDGGRVVQTDSGGGGRRRGARR